MKKWKKGTIKVPSKGSLTGRFDYRLVRTDGEVVQVQEIRTMPQPCGTIDDFNSDFILWTKGLVEVTLSMETYCVDEGNSSVYAESELKATGWREELTDAEKTAITPSTFS